MKKLFFAICFNICLFSIVDARITPVSGYANIKQEIVGNKNDAIKEISGEDFSEFLSERLKVAQKAKMEDVDNNVSVAESNIEQMIRKEKEKSFFQKAYESAIKRISSISDEEREDVSDVTAEENAASLEKIVDEVNSQKEKFRDNLLPTVKAVLPFSNVAVDVPAIEHIPYLRNNIEILPNGMVKFEETVVVVANGIKLKSGLTKILPSKIFNKKRKFQNIDYSIISVSINDTPVDYKIAKSGDNVLLVPEKEYKLPAGIYTYKFQYLADNIIMKNDKDYIFYWNVGGKGLNLIVDRTFVHLKGINKQYITEHSAVIGSGKGIFPNSVNIKENDNSYSYEAEVPIFIGTGMHLIANIDKKAFVSTTLWHKFIRSFYNYGDIYISFIGFCIIAISFAISWSYISKGKSRVGIMLNKTSAIIRYILTDKFDKKSICGFLLDLYKKNIIDIQQSGETILLIKCSDNLKSLLSYEKKALKQIFPKHETTFAVSKFNRLPLQRFARKIERGLKKDVMKFKAKLNIGYLLLSFAIMAVVWLGISAFKIDAAYTFSVIAVNTLLCCLGCMLWYLGNKKWQKIIARYFSINLIALSWIIYSAIVHPLAALLLIGATVLIVYSLKLYSGRNGLFRPYVQDIIKQKEYIIDNRDNISKSRWFTKYQSFIFVCDMEDELKPQRNDDCYKITAIKNIMERL